MAQSKPSPAERLLTGLRWLRWFLLLSCCVSGAVVAVWFWLPQQVDRVGFWLTQQYVQYYRQRLQYAEITLQSGNSKAALAQLESLLDDLESVQRGDRLTPLKREAFALSVQASASIGNNIELTRKLYQRWLAFDQHNLQLQLQRARFLARQPEHRARALEEVAQLERRFPELLTSTPTLLNTGP